MDKPKPSGWRSLDLWGVCQDCADQFSLVIRVRRHGDDLLGTLEPSREVVARDGRLTHRCGGVVKVYGHDRPIKLLS